MRFKGRINKKGENKMSKKTTRLVENESQKSTKELAEKAESELLEEKEEKQVQLIKKAIKQTLEEIRKKEKDRNKLNKEIKILKQDIDNIRAGRLDLIEERQSKDEEAKGTSIIEIIKEKEVHHYHDRWYEPYRITFRYPDYWISSGTGGIMNDSNSVTVTDANSYTLTTGSWSNTNMLTGNSVIDNQIYVTNSIAKNAVAGTYKLTDGDCITIN